MEQKIQEKFFLFYITAFELGLANSCNIEQDSCHRQPVCHKIPLRFHLTLAEIFSKSTFPKMMKKNDKCALINILQVFGTLSHIDCQSPF